MGEDFAVLMHIIDSKYLTFKMHAHLDLIIVILYNTKKEEIS